MFNFNIELERVEETNAYSFVGIYKKSEGKTVFRIPKGLNPQRYQTFTQKRDLFFRLYRVFRRFSAVLNEKKVNTKNHQQNDRISNQEIYTKEYSYTIEFADGTTQEAAYYNHFNFLEQLLETYDELKIFNLVAKERSLHHVNHYNRIHLYLDRAIFLEEDEALYTFVDQLTLPAPQIVFSETDLVQMYCYLVVEIKQYITPHDELHSDIYVLANEFKEKYLTPEESLFAEMTWQSTLQTLKECLDRIKRFTVYKSPDFWDFYDAIELFLYGKPTTKNQEGYIWGIKSFAFVWEAMCLTHIINTSQAIRYIDSQFIEKTLLNKRAQANLLSSSIFKFTRTYLDSTTQEKLLILEAKTLRPDLILEFEPNNWHICDIKYYTFNELNKVQDKNLQNKQWLAGAIRKQYVYEYLLQEHLNNLSQETHFVESEFWLPDEQEKIEYFGPIKLVYKDIDKLIEEYSQ